jgi:hypothetical protein
LIGKVLAVLRQENNDATKIRSSVFLRNRNKLLRHYAWNMEGDPDRNVTLALDAGLPGLCFMNRCPIIVNLERTNGMLVDRKHDVKPVRTWLIGMPIVDPRNFSILLNPEPGGRTSGGSYYKMERSIDGPILGVLNLDAALDYKALGLSADPTVHREDFRIMAICDIMLITAFEIGGILSSAIAAKR